MNGELARLGVIPVLVVDDAGAAGPLADALVDGGLPCAEVTFRTPAAAEAIRRMTERRPELIAGAGTVRTVAQVDAALDAGARFVVSPGLDRAVVEHCLARGVPVYPGVCTPTEVQAALAAGVQVMKLFPAAALGGPAWLRALAGPFPDVRFIPTGGIGPGNLADYLSLDVVLACGGSWLAPGEWIRAGAFDRIRKAAREAVALVERIRGKGASS